MKKVLLGLFALASVSAVAAEGVNVYGRLGLDVYSHYNKVTGEDGEVTVKAKGKVAPSIAVEVTKDLGSNFEAGLGLGYVWHGKRDYKESDIYIDIIYEDENEKIMKAGKSEAKGKIPAINSIPLYVTGKYKFDTGSDIKPYIKADLGYSFNKMKKSMTVTEKKLTTGETETYTEGLKAKNGLYAGVGVGVEYNNVTADLSYVLTKSKIKYEDGSDADKANNRAVRLTVGYKFAF